ncbi:MAG TPA: hypothetical protein VNG51_00430 [Ktedonobacteraceae bacterium]|nr:hypothetical protein [Ktedonobacteraceae bacterium]
MALIRFENPNTASVLTVTTNVLDARRALMVMLVDRTITLTAVEAQDFLDWLYQQRDALFALAHADDSNVEQGA